MNVRTFNFTYYLSKNSPLPENWPAKKLKLLQAAKSPETRASVYKELFDLSNSSNTQVSNFLCEFMANILPENVLGTSGKNKKVLNKKISQFVNFNRQETFTRITVCEKFRVNDISFMKFSATHKNAKYF